MQPCRGLNCFDAVRSSMYWAVVIFKFSTPSVDAREFHVGIGSSKQQFGVVGREGVKII
uniref:Uncharacterized protein n=1 Tax=Physcomitrium patens TaxID=3218 RepID=A0A2K1K1G4_PHYPA|nr:hypothetical protein PHYPA_012091 [Physcomitrium patens]